MHFDDLFDQDLDAYIDRAFDPASLLFYLHVPKCAGTSSVELLKREFTRNWHFQYDKIETNWGEFVDHAKQNKLDMTAGHFDFQQLNSLKKNEVDFRAVTFLRCPIERLISAYRYMCTPTHPHQKGHLMAHPTFDCFVKKQVQPNLIGNKLLGSVNSLEEYLEGLRENYTFIGLSEFYNLSMSILMESLGKKYTPAARRNVTLQNTQNEFEVSHRTYRSLESSQHLDIAVYKYLQQRFVKLSNTFIGAKLGAE